MKMNEENKKTYLESAKGIADWLCIIYLLKICGDSRQFMSI